MYPIDQNHLISSQQPIDLLERFNHRPIQFQDIFNSEDKQIKEQIYFNKGLDHPFDIGHHRLIVENNEFALDVETTMTNIVILLLMIHQNGRVILIFINLIQCSARNTILT